VISITHISWLLNNKRAQVSAVGGKFPVRNPSTKNYVYYLTAREFIKLPHVLSGDPVILLDDGDRVRVCQGGCPNTIRVDAECMLISHDTRVAKARSAQSMRETDPNLPALDLDYLRR
jgi:hypothetical protein